MGHPMCGDQPWDSWCPVMGQQPVLGRNKLSKWRFIGCSRQGFVHWASYQIRKIEGCACAGNAGNVFPSHRLEREPLVSDPGMSVLLTRGDGENVPGIPAHAQPTILRIWQEANTIADWRVTYSANFGLGLYENCFIPQFFPHHYPLLSPINPHVTESMCRTSVEWTRLSCFIASGHFSNAAAPHTGIKKNTLATEKFRNEFDQNKILMQHQLQKHITISVTSKKILIVIVECSKGASSVAFDIAIDLVTSNSAIATDIHSLNM